MSSAPTPDAVARDARWLAQAIDPQAGLVRLVAMSVEDYRAASFLDDRLMAAAPREAHVIPWAEATTALGDDAHRDARWIFHIGHVGSTLVSRLLGELPGVLALREPRALRDLALAPVKLREPFMARVTPMMSRTFADAETACVKATSLVSEIAPALVPPGEYALFLTASRRNYIASILAGENSVKELHALADYRAGRMAQRVGPLADTARSDAHRAAAAWACEMTSCEAAAEAMADRALLWADFDALLDDPATALATLAAHFGFDAAPAVIETILSGPIMRRYSKDMSYDYSPALRRELIAEATAGHRADIDSALAMLDRAASNAPLLARAIARDGDH